MTRMRVTRRALVGAAVAATKTPQLSAQEAPGGWSYPIGFPGRVLGDGFLIRHGYATENTWYNPGWLHCGEDWYALEGDTAGANIHAVAVGEVVFAGSDYPGLVVIVRHAADLFSMYGHLAADLAVATGQVVAPGDLLGTVFARTDGRAPSHLHFEARTFLTQAEVNGDAPRYDYGCGFECPPGPGYWPIGAPEHPSAMGWRNPLHAIARLAAPAGTVAAGSEVVVAAGTASELAVWPTTNDDGSAEPIFVIPVEPGDRFGLLGVEAGDPAGARTGSDAYRLWYRLVLTDNREGWVRAVEPSSEETGSDGDASALRIVLLPFATPN